MALPGARRAEARSADGGTIRYWEAGPQTGRPIVFLHGFALDHSIWHKQFCDPGLVSRYRLIAPDLRGHGASLRPAGAGGWVDGHLWASDLAAVLDAAEAEQAVVVAWSFGGRMLNDYLRHEDNSRLGALCYVAAATLSGPTTAGPAHSCLAGLCAQDAAEEREARHRFLSVILGLPPETEEYESVERVLALTTPAERAMLRQRALAYDDLFATLDLPVLVVHGHDDPVVQRGVSVRLASLIRGSELSLYPGTGHIPFRSQSQRFNQELGALVERCR